MCVPVSDEMDELAALMLAQVLNREGANAYVASSRRLTEILASVSADKPNLAVLCGLPPFAVARSQRLYRSLRARNPQLKIMVGIFNYSDDVSEVAQAFGEKEEVSILTGLSQAVLEICKAPSKDESTPAVADAPSESLPDKSAA